jgi:hypothetical protein
MAAILAFAGSGCSDPPPSQPSTSSYEARGLVLGVGSTDAVVDSSGVHGSLALLEGAMIDGVSALFIEKVSGTRSVPQGSDYRLEWTVADPTIATVAATTTWGFMVHGVKAGNTTATFKLTKGSTTIFTSSPIPIVVTAPITAFKAGDTITYDYYDHDPSTNERVATSKRNRKWIVLANGLSIYDRTNVTSVLDITYTGGGTEFERDTLYFRKADDGSVWQYDLVRQTVFRIQDGDLFAAELPAQWVKITTTASTSATAWSAIYGDSIAIPSLSLGGTNVDVLMRDNASHKGTQPTTVAAGTYADALHTDHALRVSAKLSGIGLSVINDSLSGSFDYSSRDGILRQKLDSRMLTAAIGTRPVTGYDMELKSYVHAK